MGSASKAADTRVPIHPLLADRWSPRAFDADHHLDDEDLAGLFEAARWAPSGNNSQPWRFVVGRRDDAVHRQLFDALKPGNQTWAGAASVLILAVVNTERPDGSTLRHAEYDTGGAVALLTVEATHRGLWVHQMAGFSVERAAESIGIDHPYRPLTMIAVGRRVAADVLEDDLAAKEVAERKRRPLSETAFGAWQVSLGL
ncbi:nitroreductase family protein [Euzebya tangerina]|uniref:nitroreductase family protein n=1 Tax=Euzebya tangerina TaxID=591198 RepID=UPI000E323179|nr:nitroreductase family protein [Euzebya tangerina]